MASPAGRRLRPLAVVCALLMIAWGAASIASLVAQIMNFNEFGWPDENTEGEVWTYVVLYLAAAASGAWVAVWGLFGLAWRPPLHLGAVAVLVAIGVEVAANVVQVSYFSDLGASVDLGDQAEGYVERVTFDTGFAVNEGRAFLTALPLTTAVLPLLAWLVVLFSGAGRKRSFAPQQAAPGYPHQQPQHPQPQHQQHQQPQYQQPPQPVYPPPPPPAYERPTPPPPPPKPPQPPQPPQPSPGQDTLPYSRPTEEP